MSVVAELTLTIQSQREGKLIDKTLINGMKVSVALGKAEHFKDPSKMSKFSDYKILYDITSDAESGTGAHPDDNLFQKNEAHDLAKHKIDVT